VDCGSGGEVATDASQERARRWFQERRSEYPWEQDGLDHVRRLLPDAEPYRAWATFSFMSTRGHLHECDLLVAVPGGIYLLELKGHPGRIANKGDTWMVYDGGSARPRRLHNPLALLDLKSKELRSQLTAAARRLRSKGENVRQHIPRVEPAVYLSAVTGSQLDEVQRNRVYGRDGVESGLPWVWRDLLGRPPRQDADRITAEFARDDLPRLLEEIGIRVSTAHLRFGEDWNLGSEPIDIGPSWEDRLAERTGMVREFGRVRIYLADPTAQAIYASIRRAALREYQVLQGISHPGIAQAVQLWDHPGGPAILFRHGPADLRLDAYLAVHADWLTEQRRLDLVRQLAQAVRYAHGRSLYHRALAARSVYVCAREDGSAPELRVCDWQAAARDFDAPSEVTVGRTTLPAEHVAGNAEIYLAPETANRYADPVDLDVFGVGALAYLILTGQPPAGSRAALIETMRTDQGLRLLGAADGLPAALDDLVHRATRADVGDRLASVEEFLAGLDAVERDSVPVTGAGPFRDPMEAAPGENLDAVWTVLRELGTGATARVLLVEGAVEGEDGEPRHQQRVLKVAKDADRAARLRAEAAALRQVHGGAIVRLIGGPRELGRHTVLDLEYAGEESLGSRLRAQGRLSYHDLERFGADLFTALDQLAAKGIRHRDLKPDNFGVSRRADRSRQLLLFDFSLADVPDRDVTAGTRGYLDPFIGTPRRPEYDDHAEWYAAALTLHEMASGERPVWGDGMTDPRTTDDPTPMLAADLFEPALREGLVAFFERALHRDTDRRFDTLRQLVDAWRAVFAAADAVAPATTPATVDLDPADLAAARDEHALAATLDTPLDAAGLSPRAVSVAAAFGAATVGQLLDVPLHEIARARAAGAVVRKELNRRHKQWAAALLGKPERSDGRASWPTGGAAPGLSSVDDLATRLLPERDRKGSLRGPVLRAVLGLPDDTGTPSAWPSQAEVAQRLGTTQATVSRNLTAAAAQWAGAGWLRPVRAEIVAALADNGRVMAAGELAAALRVQHGAGDDTPERTAAKAAAVLRAAIEAENSAGMRGTDGAEDGPRMAVLRRDRTVLVALESFGADEPSAAELGDYASLLGRRADELAGQDPLPGRAVVARELRTVPAPEGMAPLADTRLVALAAATSRGASASPRLELYPRDLDLARALRISQAAAGVRPDSGLTVGDLVGRVRARFPELAFPDPVSYVAMEEALDQAGFALTYDPTTLRFRSPASATISSGGSATSLLSVYPAGRRPEDAASGTAARLAVAAGRGGFLALTLRASALPGVPRALAARYPVRRVDLDERVLAVLRELAAEHGQDWTKLLAADARRSDAGRVSQGFASYLRAAWPRVRDGLLAGLDREVLFLHGCGLLARYFADGGRELLVELQRSARLATERPHGLWLLCPSDAPRDTPRLDGHVVEAIGEAEWAVLDGAFLDSIRDRPGTAA
jgi:serine/threonine protein kinase